MIQIDPSIFKAYDIRGIYPAELSEEGANLITRGFAALLKEENPGKKLKVAVGMDMRLSSPSIKEEVVKALLGSGIDVEDVGLVSTPTFYFAVANYGYDGGIQVSASHNPKNWNGLKMVRAGARALSKDTGILSIRDMIAEDRLLPLEGGAGTLSKKENVLEEEADSQFKEDDFSKIKNFKVVVDAANAMGALDMRAVLSKLPCELLPLNFELDGNFPAHEADPMKPENIRPLAEEVMRTGADLGIATDGDGDRIFLVDEKGQAVPPFVLRGILAKIELKEHPGAVIGYDIRPGRITRDMIEENGGKALVTPVGHSLIKELMLKEGAVFGGESSGHFFYKLPYGTFEAPMLVVLKILKMLTEENKPLSEVIAPYERYSHSGELNFHFPDREIIEDKIRVIKETYSNGKQTFIDGISVEFPTFWFNVRASNTEPVLRLTVEALDPEILATETANIKTLLGVS